MIHIVIPVFNRWHYTQECLSSLRDQTYRDFKVIVVDHGSTDSTSTNIKQEFPEVIVLTGDENMWWAAATNVGVNFAIEKNADFVLTLNNDLSVESTYLNDLFEASFKNEKSLVGSISVDKKDHNSIVYAGTKWNKWTAKYRSAIDLSNFEKIKNEHSIIETDLLPGRGTLIPIKAFIDFGLFDEINFPHYAADEEFSLRCRVAGYKLMIAKNAFVYSEVEATGLKNIHSKRNFKYFKDLFTSIRSPLNIKYRWKWALKCTPIPPLYFILDMSRIIISQLKSLR